MEQASKTQVIQEARVFNKLWALLKKYYNVTLDTPDSEWEQLFTEAGEIAEIETPYKIKSAAGDIDNLSALLTMNVLDYIEQMARDRGKTTDIAG